MAPTRRQFIKKAGLIGASASTLNRLVSKNAQAQSVQEVKIVNTNFLAIAYEEYGSEGDFPIILVHGFPYDVRSFDGVVGPLVRAGYRVLLPYIRGYGQTRFFGFRYAAFCIKVPLVPKHRLESRWSRPA